MRIEILSPIVGNGEFVQGQKHVFSLEAGMEAEVEDQIAFKWIESGIAKRVEREEEPVSGTPEIAAVIAPETATRKRPVARKGRRS